MLGKWRQLGLVFSPRGQGGWMKTHAQVPTPLVRAKDNVVRVFFASRPLPNLSLTTYCDLDSSDPSRVLAVHEQPILECGVPGTFDEHGIMPSCAVPVDDAVFLYYSGWSRSVAVPYTNATGLAISEDGGCTFRKYSEGPIIARNSRDPYSATSPFVTRMGNEWHMWYCSGTGWITVDGKLEHTYNIKYASSCDGLRWEPTGRVAISATRIDEAITRPWVLTIRETDVMWFCYRGSYSFRDGKDAYQLGTAISRDSMTWERAHLPELVPPREEWTSQMMAYPAVIRNHNELLLFYNGNSFGRAGVGLAIASDQIC